MRQLAFADLWGRKWVRRAAWIVAGVAVLWGVTWLAVPPLLKWQGEKLATAQLGRQVRIGAVDFRPWSLTLSLSDLSVATADGRAAQLTVRRLSVDAELQSLLRLAPVVDAVTVEAPAVRLTHHGEGRYDVDDVIERLSRPSGQPSAGPARFALYNLAVTDGAVEFTDVPVHRTHVLSALQLTLPFLSNLPSKREVRVAPRLSFVLNGSRFDSNAQATPFAPSHRTDAALRVQALDLTPYLGYLPASLPVRLQAAVLDADLWLAFEQTPATAVRLSGSLHARGIKLADARGRDLLSLDALALKLDDVRPLARTARFGDLTLSAPHLTMRRELVASWSAPPAASASAARPASPGSGAADTPWQLAVVRAGIRNGTVDWIDDSTAPPARLRLQQLTADLSDLAVPLVKPMRLKAAAQLDAAPMAASGMPRSAGTGHVTTPAAPDRATLVVEGTVESKAAQIRAAVRALPLALAAPYRAQFLKPGLDGSLGAELDLHWQAEEGGASSWQLVVNRLVMASLALGDGRTPTFSAQALELTGGKVDSATRAVSLERLLISQPSLQLARSADGRWMFEQWLAQPSTGPEGSDPPSTSGQADAAPWKLAVGELQLGDGRLAWRDQLPQRPVALDLSALQLRWTDFALDGGAPSVLQASARVAFGRGEPGRLSFRGQVRLAPALAEGRVEATRLPLDALAPYLGDTLNIEVARAETSFQGRVRYVDSAAGPRIQVAGDGLVEDFRAISVADRAPTAASGSATGAPEPRAGSLQATRQPPGEELLSWQALNLRGVDLNLGPATAPRITVKESALSDFFARVIIHENGRINLQDLVKGASSAQAPPAPGGAVRAAANGDAAAAGRAVAPQPAASSPSTAVAGSALAPVIEFGPISLLNGRVAFSDRFIRPNYSASLTELTGRLGAFSSQAPQGAPQMAELALRGRAEGTASLEISGMLNPLAQPLALDIQGRVRDLELPPLSPYSVRYAGHGIERGKLSMEVRYTVQPDGQLTASNQLVLNQLSFGDKVEGAPASLPVKLAVALLADRNGVIDINLPIRGSINDPQFRLGAVIFRLLANLIAKAITAPFALLAHAFGGGGDELGTVAFAPGRAVLDAPARQGLDRVAKALAERPALTLSVVGAADLASEQDGMRREQLRALVLAEKRRTLVRQDKAAERAADGAPAELTVDAAEYPVLLKDVYRRTDMPKPRNLIGLARELPVAEMEALLLAHLKPTEADAHALALQRGVAVRDYLMSQQLPAERLFLGAVKTAAGAAGAPGEATSAGAPRAWTPHAELNLTMR